MKNLKKICCLNWRIIMIESFKKYFIQMISDIDGEVSSKRVIGFIFTFAILITWASNLWYGKSVEQFIFDGLLYIIGISLATTVAEKFSRKKNVEENNAE